MKLCKGAILALAVSYGLTYCHTTKSKLTLEQKSDSLTVIHITNPTNYILLPIEEEAAESQVLLNTGEAADTDMDIRLAQTKVDYFVPFALPAGVKTATVRIRNKSKEALCWKEIKLSDTFDTTNTEKFRPVFCNLLIPYFYTPSHVNIPYLYKYFPDLRQSPRQKIPDISVILLPGSLENFRFRYKIPETFFLFEASHVSRLPLTVKTERFPHSILV